MTRVPRSRACRPAPLRRVAAILPAALLTVATLACDGRQRPDADAEVRPLVLSQPGVLAWQGARLPPGELDTLLESAIGFRPAAIDATRPLLLLLLDPLSLGGEFAGIVPVTDGAAFRDSLENSGDFSALGRGRYRLTPPPDGGLGQARVMLEMLRSGSLGSMFGAMSTASRGIDLELSLHDTPRGEWALFAPSFESVAALRGVLREEPDRAWFEPDTLLAGAVDLRRMLVVHAETFRQARERIEGLLGSARRVGAGAGLAAMLSGDAGGPAFAWPAVDGELLGALLQMLDSAAATALHVQISSPGSRSDRPEGLADRLRGAPLDLRIEFDRQRPLARVLGALRPLPQSPAAGALVELGADGAALGEGLSEWLRPLGEVLHGRGPPCERWLTEARRLASGWGGRLALQQHAGGWHLLLDAAGDDVSVEQFVNWAKPLLLKVLRQVAPDAWPPRLEAHATDEVRWVGADGDTWLRIGRRGRVAWVGSADGGAPSPEFLASFERLSLAEPAPGAPALRVAENSGAPTVLVHRSGDRLHLQVRAWQ